MGERRTPFDPPRSRDAGWWALAAAWDYGMGLLVGCLGLFGDWLIAGTCPWRLDSLLMWGGMSLAYGTIFLCRRSRP